MGKDTTPLPFALRMGYTWAMAYKEHGLWSRLRISTDSCSLFARQCRYASVMAFIVDPRNPAVNLKQ